MKGVMRITDQGTVKDLVLRGLGTPAVEEPEFKVPPIQSLTPIDFQAVQDRL